MTSTTETPRLAGIPKPPIALTRALAPTVGADWVVRDLDADHAASQAFLAAACAQLPGRRFESPRDVVALLGEERSLRIALLASGVYWLKTIAGDSAFAPPMLRHAIAAAICSGALARSEERVDERFAFALGLLHHIGDAIALRARRENRREPPVRERFSIGGELLRQCGLPDPALSAYLDYGRFLFDPTVPHGRGMVVLAASDHAATALGYAAPAPCVQAATNASVLDLVARLFESKNRLGRVIEENVTPLLAPRVPEPTAPRRRSVSASSPLVLPETMEGVSARDLGPLPVLFTRIEEAGDEEGIVVAATAGLVEEFGFPRAYYLHRRDDDTLVGGALCSRGNAPLPIGELTMDMERVPRSLRLALETGRPILQQGLSDAIGGLSSASRAATFYFPVGVGRRRVGVMAVEVPDPDAVLPDLLAAVGSHAGLALERAELRRRSDDAKTDELTGLLNRRGILEVLDHHVESARREQHLAVALFDCDHLKKVNDNFGHLMGDEFVRRISEVLRRSLRKSDELGRYGGDEFLAVLPGADKEHVSKAMERCRSAVERAGLESDDGLLLSVSIGACVRGRSGASRERLLKLADHALYRAKERGRNAVDVIDAENPPELAL